MSPPAGIKKILVAVLDNLGDAVMATAVLRPLRDVFPAATFGLWVKKYAAPLFADQSLLDVLHACDPFWDRSPGQGKGSVGEFMKTLRQIRTQRYDAAFILNTEWRRSLACWWAGIPARVGYRRRKSGVFLTHPVDGPSVGQHFIDDHKHLLEVLCGPLSSIFLPRIDVAAAERRWAEEWLRARGWDGQRLIALHPFAGRASRCWPLKNWAELVRRLAQEESRARFVVLHGPGEGKDLENQFAAIPGKKVAVLGEAPLHQAKVLISRARLFMGSDSGPGHLAAAVGTPVVSLFADSNPDRCAPRGHAPVKILSRETTGDLTVDDVYAEASAALKAGSSAVPL